jgi:polyhydroxyalkanoate synthesis repressor PhaR
MPQRGMMTAWPGGDAVVRLLKRYGSRKLYDTEESRYATFDELVGWIRAGQHVRIVDNATGEDVTSATLAQIIAEEGRRGSNVLSIDLLHELIRKGEETMRSGVEKILEVGFDRLGPVRKAREEMSLLRARIEQLETALTDLEGPRVEKASAHEKKGRSVRGRSPKQGRGA